MYKKFKQIRLLNKEMRFTNVNLEELIESDVFDLVVSGHISKQDFATWVEHQRDIWFNIGSTSKHN